MFGRKNADVLVVGAGPVGLLTALTLAQRGVSVQIVDKAERTGKHSYGLALHPSSLQLLDDVNVLGEVVEQAIHVRRIGLYDYTDKRAELQLAQLPDDYSFVAVMRQADLESALESALREAKLKVTWQHGVALLEPTRTSNEVTLDRFSKDSVGYSVQHTEWIVASSKQHQYRYVLGTDGIHSMVRRRMDIEFPEVAESTDFAVFEFKTDMDLGDEMRLVFGADTTNVLWPLPGGHCRFSFQIPRDESIDEDREKERSFVRIGGGHFPMLDASHLHELLAERAPWFTGSVEDIRWRMEVRFENRLAESFGKWHTWLAGDAGHCTGPAGVQSMNVGLREGVELARLTWQALDDQVPKAAFEAYEQERLAEWRTLLGVDGRLVATDAVDPWIAAIAPRLLPCVPASGDDLKHLLGQVGLKLESGPVPV